MPEKKNRQLSLNLKISENRDPHILIPICIPTTCVTNLLDGEFHN